MQAPGPAQPGRYGACLWYRRPMTPVHSDTPRFSIWDPTLLIVAGVMLLLGLTGGGVIPVLSGLGMGFYLWYTKHTRYDLFQDVLVTRYRAPRTRVVPLSDVLSARFARTLLGGPALSIQRRRGGVLVITPKDPEAFLSHLEDGLSTREEPPKPKPRAERSKPTPRTRRLRRRQH